MKTTSFQLGQFDDYIKEEIATGDYKNASEVIREGLRLLKSERAKIKLIRKLIEEGEASGIYGTFKNAEELFNALHEETNNKKPRRKRTA